MLFTWKRCTKFSKLVWFFKRTLWINWPKNRNLLVCLNNFLLYLPVSLLLKKNQRIVGHGAIENNLAKSIRVVQVAQVHIRFEYGQSTSLILIALSIAHKRFQASKWENTCHWWTHVVAVYCPKYVLLSGRRDTFMDGHTQNKDCERDDHDSFKKDSLILLYGHFSMKCLFWTRAKFLDALCSDIFYSV